MLRSYTIYIFSIVTGGLHVFFLAFLIALSSGSSEITWQEVMTHILFYINLLHVSLSSWLFLWKPKSGHILGLISGLEVLILSFFWLNFGYLIAVLIWIISSFSVVVLHAIGLKNKNSDDLIGKNTKIVLSILAPLLIIVLLGFFMS